MTRTKVEVFEKLYEATFSATKSAADTVLAEKRLKQVKDGKAHPLWLMGHLTFATDSILNGVLLGGRTTLPEQYQRMFSPGIIGGAPVTADAAAYPAWDDVVSQYARVTAVVLDKLKSVVDVDLQGGVKGKTPPGFEEFFKSFEGVLNTMVLHDTYHRGQMNLLANA